MDKVLTSLQMEILLWANISLVSQVVKANTSGEMVPLTLEILLMVVKKDLVSGRKVTKQTAIAMRATL